MEANGQFLVYKCRLKTCSLQNSHFRFLSCWHIESIVLKIQIQYVHDHVLNLLAPE